ncbi:MAG: hypothetical protein ACRDN1_22075 [Trebonia sp.]
MSGVTTGEFRALQERVEGLAAVADRLDRTAESISVNIEVMRVVWDRAFAAGRAADAAGQDPPPPTVRGRHLHAVDGTSGDAS